MLGIEALQRDEEWHNEASGEGRTYQPPGSATAASYASFKIVESKPFNDMALLQFYPKWQLLLKAPGGLQKANDLGDSISRFRGEAS